MRKFLIVLILVMATFLFVGCNGVTPEPVIPNNPPEIISSAITSGKVGVAYNYGVEATDPEEDVLTYSLTENPLGMSIVSTTGIISWTPTDAGLFGVGVKVSDPDGLFDVQSFNITVAKADEPVEPEPEPELVLVGITVDPKTIDLIVGESETIESVTATYEIRGYGVILDFEDCLFLSSDTDVATVSDKGEVTAVGEGTADIVVSYKGKFDTLKVTVIYKPMELIVDVPIFEVNITDPENFVGVPAVFTVEVVANSDSEKNVKFYFKLPEGDYTIDLLYENEWCDLVTSGVAIYDEDTEEYALGGISGDPLIDETRIFRGTFNEVMTYSTTIEVRTYPGDVLLCSKVITAKVIPVIPPING